MARVFLPPAMRDLTNGVEAVEAQGTTVRQLIAFCAGGLRAAPTSTQPLSTTDAPTQHSTQEMSS